MLLLPCGKTPAAFQLKVKGMLVQNNISDSF